MPFGEDVLYRLPGQPAGPWIFRKMVTFPTGSVAPGAYVALRTQDNQVIGRGIYQRHSEIAFRLLGGPDAPENFSDLLALRLGRAHDLRTKVLDLPARTDAFRWVNSEGDNLSGLIVDRYGKTAVAAVFSMGYIVNAEILERALLAFPGVERVLFRADDRTEKLEGFHLPDLPPGLEETVHEDQIRFKVDLSLGHKTGLFLDQRDQRLLIRGLAKGKRMLDLATNAGGFALSAAKGGASAVTGLDLDEKALARAQDNAKHNRLKVEWVRSDMFPWLRDRAQAGEKFDVVVLDPPKLAAQRREVAKALSTYRDMNALALSVLNPGGLLLSCSCSGSVGEDEFAEMLWRTTRENKREARVLARLGAGPDHPVALSFPEGRYLKAFLLSVE